VAATRPEAALEALAVIEEEASRTLAEMRTMVTALRQGDEPELAPQRGAADIARLADATPGQPGPRVDVELAGDLTALWPPVDAALYRLAQESITNALRHARHATRVVVRAEGDADEVRLTVSDDGDTGFGAGGSGTPGFGLVGMTERAHLLGGTLEAGPRPDGGGWTVRAVLPRSARNGTAS
jgi:signal transduction histidine kinase